VTLHIFDTGYDPSRSGDFEHQLNDIKEKNMVPDSTDNTTVKKFYQDLFNIQDIKASSIVMIDATVSYYSHTAEYHLTFAKHVPKENDYFCPLELVIALLDCP